MSNVILLNRRGDGIMFQYLNIELTTHCNKSCWFCGRAKARQEGTLELGYMDIRLFKEILMQFTGDIIQLHKDGEPLLYPDLWKVGYLCRKEGKISNIVTNGKLLWEKRRELMEFDTICVSVIEDDIEQIENIKRFRTFCDIPILIKFLGDYHNPLFEEMGLPVTRRAIHHPIFDKGYEKPPVIPELLVCWDFLMKPSVNWKGDFSICNRYDPEGLGVLGNFNKTSLYDLWYSEKRKEWLEYHKQFNRHKAPLCATCQFWGCPVG